MKKVVALLLILTMSRVAVAYAATPTTTSNQQSYFFGNTAQGQANLNQVLALLVGPRGVPGAAGVAGKDGFVGLNGQDGKNGLDGAPGAVGPQGPAGAPGKNGVDGRNGANGANGVANLGAFAVIAVGAGIQCPTGGTKIVDVAGNENFVCNGSTGGGADSATVVTALDGVSANATFNSASCQSTQALGIKFNRSFTGDDFVLGDIELTNIKSTCVASPFKKIRFYFKTQPVGTALSNSTNYSNNRFIRCSFDITATDFNTDSSNTNACVVSSNAAGSSWPSTPTFSLADISTADFISKIGFEIV